MKECKYQDVFSKDDRNLGRTSIVQHNIGTGDNKAARSWQTTPLLQI